MVNKEATTKKDKDSQPTSPLFRTAECQMAKSVAVILTIDDCHRTSCKATNSQNCVYFILIWLTLSFQCGDLAVSSSIIRIISSNAFPVISSAIEMPPISIITVSSLESLVLIC